MSNYHNMTDQELVRHVDNMLWVDPLARELANRFDAVLGALHLERTERDKEQGNDTELKALLGEIETILEKAGEL